MDSIAWRPWLLAALPCLTGWVVAGCALPNSPEACAVTALATVPIRLDADRPVVDVLVGGRPARVVLDTGATQTLLTDAAFDRLGLPVDPGPATSTAGVAGQATARVSQPVPVTIGAVRTRPIVVAATASMSMLQPGDGIDGLLGLEPLADYDLDIDIPHRRLGVYAPRLCPDGPAPFEGPSIRYRSVPNPFHLLSMPAAADGHALSLVIDTGASRTFLDRGRAGLAAGGDGEPVVMGRSAGPGSVEGRLHRFRTVTLGDTTWHELNEMTGPMPFGLDGLLGMDFWRGRRVWLSFAGWVATVQRRGAE